MTSPSKTWASALALLPALLLAAVHQAWLRAPLVTRIEEASKRIEEADRLSRAGQSELAAARALSTELAGLASERQTLEERKQQLLEEWTDAGERVATVGEVSAVFQRRGIQIRRSSFERDENGPSPGPVLMRLARTMSRWGAPPPELWQLEIRSPYPSLIAALEDCAKLEAFSLIVSLSADTTRDLDTLDFKLWMWI